MNEGLLSISPACCGQLVKILITLKPNGIFWSDFAYLFTLWLSSQWYAIRWGGFAEHHFGWSRSFSANAHNSWAAWYILHTNAFYILMQTVTRLHQDFFFMNPKTLAYVVQRTWISSLVARIYVTLVWSSPRLGKIVLVLYGEIYKLVLHDRKLTCILASSFFFINLFLCRGFPLYSWISVRYN